jgi:hypothetical protein
MGHFALRLEAFNSIFEMKLRNKNVFKFFFYCMLEIVLNLFCLQEKKAKLLKEEQKKVKEFSATSAKQVKFIEARKFTA